MRSELPNGISPVDIMYILENTWEKSKGEWLITTKSERQETLQFIKDRLKSTEADGFSKLWKTPDKEPIALLGVYLVGDKRYETFLICSRHMEDHSMKLSFDMRNILKELSLKYKGCTLVQYAVGGNTDQISWFRFLGFAYKPEGNIGTTQYFEYKAPDK